MRSASELLPEAPDELTMLRIVFGAPSETIRLRRSKEATSRVDRPADRLDGLTG